jgi:hypothetical protein
MYSNRLMNRVVLCAEDNAAHERTGTVVGLTTSHGQFTIIKEEETHGGDSMGKQRWMEAVALIRNAANDGAIELSNRRDSRSLPCGKGLQ